MDRPVAASAAPHRAGLLHRLHQRAFGALYGRSLLYNTCWEDPAVDRQALRLGPDDTVLVITSAGCNALDYALDAPHRVFAVDANPMQTALLELKLAGIRRLPHPEFFRIFGLGRHEDFARLYHGVLRPELSDASRQIWDRRLRWFATRGRRAGLYYRGLSGLVARLMRTYIDRRSTLRLLVDELLDCQDLERQRCLYDQIEPRLFTRGLTWALERQVTMSLLGVPWAQREEVAASHDDGIAGFIRSCLDHVGRQLPFRDNYFWSVYLRGHYTPTCCPGYLTEAGFARLQGGLVDRVEARTATVTAWLREQQTRISRFVLLDHMDWMGSYYPEALAEEWQAILARATPDARTIFRSGARQPAFLDSIAVAGPNGARPLRSHLRLHPELAARLDREDRVHTYASFHIADLVA